MTTATPVYISIDGVYYTLTHAPDLVRYGSKPSREIAANGARLGEINKQLRKFTDAVCYAPHQVFIGSITPQQLADLPAPWYGKLIEGARAQGKFGDIVSQDQLYAMLAQSDHFKLVALEEKWFQEIGAKYANGASALTKSAADIKALCEKTAIPLFAGDRLVGAFDTDYAEDANLAPDVLLENLAAKATAAHSLRALLDTLNMKPSEVDYVISCSEEAIGDRYNRGGGNLAKAIAEDVGCENASGSDTKAFCAGPMYAMVHGASLIQAGVVRNVAVVAGGSLAKLGMKFESHVKGNMPILEDILGSFAVMLSAAKQGAPSIRLDSAAFHPVRAGGSPQAMAEFLAEKPLAKLGMKFTDVDRYAVELHNPEITVPSGSGDVPRTNYRTLAALAVMRGHIKKEQMEEFARTRGMVGYAPTQGHIPSAVSYLGHALDALRAGEIRNTLFIAKGSLFLGRMTQLSDGCSFLVERNQG